MEPADRYLILKPCGAARDVPKELLPYLDTVRRTSVWRALGLPVKLDEYGYPSHDYPPRGRLGTCRFFTALESDSLIAEAIRTGKRAVRHPLAVFDYVLAGCDLSEFPNLPEDVKAYCQGNLLRVNGELEKALPLLEQACSLNPDEVRYREVYYPLRLVLGDLSSIQDELAYFERDMDSIVHAGRFDAWIKALIAAQEYSTARQIISLVDMALSRLVEGSMTPRFYCQQKGDWYAYKRVQFRKKAEKFMLRIQKLEEKGAHAVARNKAQSNRDVPSSHSESAKAILATDVEEVLYNFAHGCFAGKREEEPLDLSEEDCFFAILINGPLRLLEVHQLPSKHKHLLRELLTQYIMFLEMNQGLPFPTSFLDGSSKEQLGPPLLQYIHEHRWPFPQMLPLKQ